MTTAQLPFDAPTAAAVGSPLDLRVGRPVPARPGFLEQIEACRREVAQWPAWMRQERYVPDWMTNHATDL